MPASSQPNSNGTTANPKLGIFGGPFSFHALALRQLPGKYDVSNYYTFSELVTALVAGEVAFALMAAANSIYGPIIPNYELLAANPVTVVADVRSRIIQHLVALPGVRFQELEEVHSQAVALGQCGLFLAQHPQLRVVAGADTATCVREIAERKRRTHAAIAGPEAAAHYGLEVVVENVADAPFNFTRFLLLAKTGTLPPQPDTAATTALLQIETRHEALPLLQELAEPARLNEFVPVGAAAFVIRLDGLTVEILDKAITEISGLFPTRVLGRYAPDPNFMLAIQPQPIKFR